MRVLLVTNEMNLSEKLAVLSPELEYCGIVVDDVEPAKKTLADRGLSQVPLYPMNELRKCVDNINYDYLLHVKLGRFSPNILPDLVKDGVPRENMLCLSELSHYGNFSTERILRYYKEHWQDFDAFVTGISWVNTGIDITKFKLKLANFSNYCQDLYYDFQIVKNAVICGGGA